MFITRHGASCNFWVNQENSKGKYLKNPADKVQCGTVTSYRSQKGGYIAPQHKSEIREGKVQVQGTCLLMISQEPVSTPFPLFVCTPGTCSCVAQWVCGGQRIVCTGVTSCLQPCEFQESNSVRLDGKALFPAEPSCQPVLPFYSLTSLTLVYRFLASCGCTSYPSQMTKFLYKQHVFIYFVCAFFFWGGRMSMPWWHVCGGLENSFWQSTLTFPCVVPRAPTQVVSLSSEYLHADSVSNPMFVCMLVCLKHSHIYLQLAWISPYS